MTKKKPALDEHLKKMKNRHRTKTVQERFTDDAALKTTLPPKKVDDPYVVKSFHSEVPPPKPFPSDLPPSTSTSVTVKKKKADDY